jgi:leucyl/phenylalanyl-tRNA--protein transferase
MTVIEGYQVDAGSIQLGARDATSAVAIDESCELNSNTLEWAYSRGRFPWFRDGEPMRWWAPEDRMVLYPERFVVSTSLRKTLKRFARDPSCEVRIDSAFDAVIANCSEVARKRQNGTWINREIIDAYTAWHREGYVHSFETWCDGKLIGGMYGVNIGSVFFGESAFCLQPNGSKIAIAAAVSFSLENKLSLIDAQVHTNHMASLGAIEIPRTRFEQQLSDFVARPRVRHWAFTKSMWKHLKIETESLCGVQYG